jgi:hypothetical protein
MGGTVRRDRERPENPWESISESWKKYDEEFHGEMENLLAAIREDLKN